LLSDDGSPLTGELAQTLIGKGWRVVVISFSLTSEASLPPEVNRVVIENSDEALLQQQLSNIASKYGSIAATIYLHPLSQAPEREHNMLKNSFLMAKHLKKSLNEAAKLGDSCFFTVAHLDGELGTGGKTEFSAVTGGLFGLTKSLRWEWEAVFCRAIDLSTDLDTATSVRHIIAELHDPNRLITEVGYSSEGRCTLVC
jgi:hypothetical protein